MKYGPGIVLRRRVIEDLIESKAFDRFDFGSGDASVTERVGAKDKPKAVNHRSLAR